MLYDITPPISPDLAVWPGDTSPRREVLLDLARGDSVTLSTLHATVHLGAHADGPNHYSRVGADIASRQLGYYLGPCRVVRTRAARRSRVELGDIATQLDPKDDSGMGIGRPLPPRVLIATGTAPDPIHFSQDFAGLDPDLVDALAARGVITIGVDTPSVDLFESKDLPAHQAFHRNDMAILEGLDLHAVPEGDYELISLPLPLVGFDASPVRAILRTLD